MKNGKIAGAAEMEPAEAIDAAGCIVTPDLIDYHCHVGTCMSDLGVDEETIYVPAGVTIAEDAGTSGTANYEAFRQVTFHSRLRRGLRDVDEIHGENVCGLVSPHKRV